MIPKIIGNLKVWQLEKGAFAYQTINNEEPQIIIFTDEKQREFVNKLFKSVK